MKAIIFVVLSVIAVAFAQVSPPSWPSAFSATILAKRSHNGFPVEHMIRWFYDYSQQKERIDGPAFWHNEVYMATRIVDYTSNIETDIFFQEDVATCLEINVNWTMPDPDFSKFSYMGTSIVGLWKANYFTFQDQRGDWFNLWSKVTTNEILRVNMATPYFMEETWTFLEMDVSSQDSDLFIIPDLISGQCNSPPSN